MSGSSQAPASPTEDGDKGGQDVKEVKRGPALLQFQKYRDLVAPGPDRRDQQAAQDPVKSDGGKSGFMRENSAQSGPMKPGGNDPMVGLGEDFAEGRGRVLKARGKGIDISADPSLQRGGLCRFGGFFPEKNPTHSRG